MIPIGDILWKKGEQVQSIASLFYNRIYQEVRDP